MMAITIVLNCSVGSLLMVVKPLLMLFDRFRQRQDEFERLCYKIGGRYYDIVETVSQMLFEAKRVSEDDLSPLRQVNSLLRKFNYELNGIQNIGRSSDIDILDVRKKFGNSAAEVILKLDELFLKLDEEGKEPDKWQLVCSATVIRYSYGIISQWNVLLAIMACKRFMRKKTLTRDFNEKFLGI